MRRAEEDDNKLDNYMANGIMQRHTGGSSSFVAVHEPFQSDPWIKSVSFDGDSYVIKYELEGRQIEDRIRLTTEGISVISGAGWEYN